MLQKILEYELKPALGCTEPMAFALCAASARAYAHGAVARIGIEASAAMIKGVQYVKIPNSGGRCGGRMACALGALAGNAADGMQVFQRVQAEDAAAAERMIAAGQVRIELKEDVPRLWLRVTVTGSEGTGVAIVQDRHDNVAYLESDGNVLRDTRSAAEAEDAPDYGALSVETIWEFCTHAPLARLARAEEAVRLNTALSEEGLRQGYGMQTGKTLTESGMLGGGTAMDAVCAGCAGVDARMGGAPLAAMSNSGSGNQGVTCTAPVAAAGRRMGRSHEEIVRAAAAANLLTVFLKTRAGADEGRIAPVCGAALAAGGAAGWIAMLRGDDADCVERMLRTVLGNVCGMVCDGAKASCAAKIGLAVENALMALELSLAGNVFQPGEGMTMEDPEDTIAAVGRMGRVGMKSTDVEILNIMLGN